MHKEKMMIPVFSLVFAALGAFLVAVPSARADSAEIRAEIEQQAFDREFELYDDDSLESAENGDPDWKKLLRPKVRQKIGRKKYVRVTPSIEYGVILTGPSAYREGATKSIAPASTSKVFTAALALKHLGPDYVFTNRLVWQQALSSADAGYLRLIGSGDPSFTPWNFSILVDQMILGLESAKTKRVYGPITLESTDARWSLRVKPAGWKVTDPLPPDAFGGTNIATVRRILAAKLRARGIQWLETVVTPFLPALSVPGEAVYRSAPMKTLIHPLMLKSINSFGEALVRKVGEVKGSRSAENLHIAGMAVLREFVDANVGKNRVTLNDGSGLSRTSRITADAMIEFLHQMKLEPFFEDFVASFPVAGRTGTLETRMRKTSAAGKIHGKTGTIDRHYQIAGYLAERGRNGKEYHPFVILTQTSIGNSAYCRSTQDKVLAKLASID